MIYSKHLVNDPHESVFESMSGFVHANNQNLICLKDYSNVVLRRDYQALKQDTKVAILSGGGSGHEPAHLGYIGKGMLTGAICGDLFASPSTDSILASIRACDTPSGVLLIVKNYTGDRLHFGLAASRARSQGIQVEMVLVNDDVALVYTDKGLNTSDSVGRRGLCGTVVIHKLAGALAEQGKPLSEIKSFIETILSNNLIRTVGVSLSGGVDLPLESCIRKQGVIATEEIEIGLGIHGEAGRKRIKIPASYYLVKQMFENIEFSLRETSKLDVCLIINNLGGLSNFELNLLIHDCCKLLLTERPQYRIRRLLAGSLMTSLNMNGFSLTLLVVDNVQTLELLDLDTNASAWPKTHGRDIQEIHIDRPKSTLIRSKLKIKDGKDDFYVLNDKQALLLKQSIQAIFEGLIEFKNYLNELDSKCGDGDCGNSMESFSLKVLSIANTFEYKNPHEVLSEISHAAEQCGGTMNAILAIGISSAAKAFIKSKNQTKWVSIWSQGLDYAVASIEEFGGARPGHRSLLDPLYETNEWLKLSRDQELDIYQILKNIVDISYKSAQKTSLMIPRVGRASYVDPSTIKTPDPGAMAINHAFCSIHKTFLEHKQL